MKLKREAKLALTAIAAVFVLIWGINFLKGSSLFESKSIFYGVYNSVEGLKVSSGVVYRGYQVGQVISIQFTGERYDKVLVKFSVNKGLELPSNSLAMIQSADLMGSKVIDLIPGDSPVFAVSGDTLTSKTEQGLMEQVSRQMLPLKQKAERLLGSLDSVMGMSDLGFGMWAGTAINDTSSVVAAGYSYSEDAGSYATIVKLTRALMIVPVCLFFAVLTARKAKAEGQGFDLKRIFPFFILWFVVASIVNTSGILPEALCNNLGDFGKFCIVWAMAAIGLNTNLMSLVKNGVRPIFLGLCCWIAVAVVSLIVQHIVGII